MDAIYDRIGRDYSVMRQTDPRIQQLLLAELTGATCVLNIGAGSGSYEPDDIELVAVEPSMQMIAQRKIGSHPVEQAFAEDLPFADNSFSHAMTVLSMHHWQNHEQAFAEINRVATDTFVAITWDPSANPFWLTRDYFPDIHSVDRKIFPDLNRLDGYFDDVRIMPLPIPDDCQDGFLAAYWKRPHAYLEAQVRQAISAFAKIDNLSAGLQTLKDDLNSGVWASNNADIATRTELDVGYRLVVAKIRRC